MKYVMTPFMTSHYNSPDVIFLSPNFMFCYWNIVDLRLPAGLPISKMCVGLRTALFLISMNEIDPQSSERTRTSRAFFRVQFHDAFKSSIETTPELYLAVVQFCCRMYEMHLLFHAFADSLCSRTWTWKSRGPSS